MPRVNPGGCGLPVQVDVFVVVPVVWRGPVPVVQVVRVVLVRDGAVHVVRRRGARGRARWVRGTGETRTGPWRRLPSHRLSGRSFAVTAAPWSRVAAPADS